jgi:hypothetical protein
VTVIKVSPGELIDASYLQSRIQHYSSSCDVFSLDFLHCVEFVGADREEVEFPEGAEAQLKEWGTSWIKFVAGSGTNDKFSPGPYVVVHRHLRQVWRVYDDHAKAFLVATWPSEHDSKYVLSCPS